MAVKKETNENLAPILIDKKLKTCIIMLGAKENKKYFEVLNEIVSKDERIIKYLSL